MKIEKLPEPLGAKVYGLDLRKNLTQKTILKLQDAFVTYQVLIFHEQKMFPDQQIAFSKHFGLVEKLYTEEHRVPEFPEVVVLSNEKVNGKYIGVLSAGDFWHSDLSYQEETGLATFLYALKLPSKGGDTEFSNLFSAYNTLPKKIKKKIHTLNGVHTANKLRNSRVEVTRPGGKAYYDAQAQVNDVTHPIVRIHPVSGRKSLYVSPRFTIGIDKMENSDAQPLLDYLFQHQTKSEHTYRHKWQLGDLVMWDNRSINHRACGGYSMDDIRLIHRTSTRGDKPFGPSD